MDAFSGQVGHMMVAVQGSIEALGVSEGGPEPVDSVGIPAHELRRIAEAARTNPPFETIDDPLGHGIGSAAQQMNIERSTDGANGSAKAGVAAVAIGFSLPFLIIEIIRDFWQIMSLVLSVTFTSPYSLNVFFGRFAFFIALDFPAFFVNFGVDRETVRLILWWVIFVVALALSVALRRLVNHAMPDPRREFAMLRTWAMLDRKLAKRMRGTVFILTLIYLPVSQMALEVLFCSHNYIGANGKCAEWYEFIAAIILVLVITLYLPVNLFRIIRSNAPKIREFDWAGEPRNASDSQQEYLADLARRTRKNPIASLFNEYYRPMRYHKVIIMMLKLFLILVAVGLSSNRVTGYKRGPDHQSVPTREGNETYYVDVPIEPTYYAETEDNQFNHARPLLMILGLLAYAILCITRRPFISGLANVLDVVLRGFAIVAVLCAYLIMFKVAEDPMEVIFNVALGLTLAVSIVFILFSFDAVQEKYRVTTGDAKLTPVNDEDPNPIWFNVMRIDFARERKYRVWQHYWTTLFTQTHPFRLRPPPIQLDAEGEEIEDEVNKQARVAAETADYEYVDNDDTVAYLLDFKGSVSERHTENSEIAIDIGREKFVECMSSQPVHDVENVIFVTRVLHGLDVYLTTPYQGQGGNGAWGCLYALPVPYEFFFLPDHTGGEEHRLSSPSDLQRLVADNLRADVRYQRNVREQLRGLAYTCALGYHVNFEFTEYQTITIGSGNQKQQVSVLVTFDQGKLLVSGNDSKPVFTLPLTNENEPDHNLVVVPGFTVTLTFAKGTYEAHGGGTVGERVISHAELGITATYERTAELSRLLDYNADAIENGRIEVVREKDAFRKYFMSEFTAKSLTLSYAFWPKVFNNDRISPQELRDHVRGYERNPQVQALATKEEATTVSVPYARLQYFDSCPAVALWVCFWHDLYHRNLDMSMVAENEDIQRVLNPWVPESLVWNVLSKTRTNQELQSVGLQTESGGGFINAKMIDRLYDAMGEAMAGFDPSVPNAHIATTAVPTSTHEGHYDEVMRHPAYGNALAPFTYDNYRDERLAGITRMLPGHDGFYQDDHSSKFTHYQRYPIVAQRFGGVVPEDAYVP
jgi:hypothetical protein